MSDLTLVAVGLFQLAFGVFLGWLRWGRPITAVPLDADVTHGRFVPKSAGTIIANDALAAYAAETRLESVEVIGVSREQLARIDAQDEVPPGLAELVATCGVEVVEATPEEWSVIQRKLDAEDAAHALEHQGSREQSRADFDAQMAAEYERGLTLGMTRDELRRFHREAWCRRDTNG